MAAYQPNGVVFDGSTNLARGANYTSVVDGSKLTIAFAFKFSGSNADQHIFSGKRTAGSGNVAYVLGRSATGGTLYFALYNSAGTKIAGFTTATDRNDSAWHNVLVSQDSVSPGHQLVYIDDVDITAELTGVSLTVAGTGDFGCADHMVAAHSNAAAIDLRFVGELADPWVDFGRYVDFSVEANRRLFFGADDSLADKGLDGSVPFSAVPTLFLSGPVPLWGTNKGSGGGMTTTGAMTRSSALPSAAAGVQTLVPTSIEASTNFTGAITVADEAVDDPDANWLTATSATAATDVRVGFGTPT